VVLPALYDTDLQPSAEEAVLFRNLPEARGECALAWGSSI
jgi:hypothetical protein